MTNPNEWHVLTSGPPTLPSDAFPSSNNPQAIGQWKHRDEGAMSSCFSAWNGCDLIMHPMTSTELQVLERHISSLGQTRLGARGTSVTTASLAAWLQFAWVDTSGHNLVSFVVTHQSWYCWNDVGEEGQRRGVMWGRRVSGKEWCEGGGAEVSDVG